MWNYMPTLGHSGHIVMGPNKNQTREFGFHIPNNFHIVPGKVFSNPNFVNPYPIVHNHQYNNNVTPQQRSQSDAIIVKSSISENSSSERPADKQYISENTTSNQDMCSIQKRPKRSRRNRKRKASQRKPSESKLDKMIGTEDTHMEIDSSSRDSYLNMNIDLKTAMSSPSGDSAQSFESCEESPISPIASSLSCKPPLRERQASIADSEDSFIIFQSGTDEELIFSESEDEPDLCTENEDHSTVEEDPCSSPGIPTKKVRFADDSGLCEVHRMVQWSYAYQQARKGPWEEYARDRDRFNKRIKELEGVLSPVFDPIHRKCVYNERFKNDAFSL